MTDHDRPTSVRYGVLFGLCSLASIAYLARSGWGVVAADQQIGRELGCSDQQLASAMSAFYLAYALGQLPCSWLGRYWGSRVALPVFVLVLSVCSAVVGWIPSWLGVFAAWTLLGLAQAGIFPTAAQSIKHWFPTTRIGLASGLLASCMSVGAAIGAVASGWLVEHSGWRSVFLIFALPGLAWAAAFWFWFRETPEVHAAVNARERELIRGEPWRTQPASATAAAADADTGSVGHERIPWLAWLGSVTLWLICSQQFFRAAGQVFFNTWFPKYLKEVHLVTSASSGYLSSLPQIALIVGCALGGFVSDWLFIRTGSRRISWQAFSVSCLLVCSLLIGVAFWAHSALAATWLIAAGTFFAAMAGPNSYSITISKAGVHIPIVFAIMNMAGNLGASASPIAAERFQNWTGGWHSVPFLFAGIYVAAAACWMLLSPDRPLLDRTEH